MRLIVDVPLVIGAVGETDDAAEGNNGIVSDLSSYARLKIQIYTLIFFIYLIPKQTNLLFC